MNNRGKSLFLVGVLSLFLVACGGSQIESPVTPASDKLTFLYFYTDSWIPWQNMQPIVNGLKDEYIDQIEFRNMNASSGEGKQAFQAYRLLGHPSYVVLNESGEIIWKELGEKTSDQIKVQLELMLQGQ